MLNHKGLKRFPTRFSLNLEWWITMQFHSSLAGTGQATWQLFCPVLCPPTQGCWWTAWTKLRATKILLVMWDKGEETGLLHARGKQKQPTSSLPVLTKSLLRRQKEALHWDVWSQNRALAIKGIRGCPDEIKGETFPPWDSQTLVQII